MGDQSLAVTQATRFPSNLEGSGKKPRGRLHQADFFVYFAKYSVNTYCRQVRSVCFVHLDKILSNSTKLQRSRDKKSASPRSSRLFSVTKSISTFHTPLMHIHLSCSFQSVPKRVLASRSSSMDRENFAHFPYQSFDYAVTRSD